MPVLANDSRLAMPPHAAVILTVAGGHKFRPDDPGCYCVD